MKFTIHLPPSVTTAVALNRCGYATFRDPNTGETSYVRRFGTYYYPRYHLYIQSDQGSEAQLSVHLDMKQPTYIRGRAHSGEYDGDRVIAEARRIIAHVASLKE